MSGYLTTAPSTRPAPLRAAALARGQTIPVTNLNYTAGSNATITNLAAREAADQDAIPANTPAWEFTLAQSAGELMMVLRRGTVPDFNALYYGNVQYQTEAPNGDREIKIQKTGPERFLMLPVNDADYITAGDYYIAVISEGSSPPDSSTIGTGTSSGVLTSLGGFSTASLGAATAGGLVQPVTLAGGQIKAYTFTVPAGTASLEVRLDNRVGNPFLSLISGSRTPRPEYYGADYGYHGGQTSGVPGGTDRIDDADLLTVANPLPGTYTATVRADFLSPTYPDASANLVIVANAPVPLAFNGGTANITSQSPTAWRYFSVTVPAGVMGWDIRVKNITGGTPLLVVRRDDLPAGPGTTPWTYPENSDNWPTGYAIGGQVDWSNRQYQVYADPYPQVGERLVLGMGRPLEPGTYLVGVYNSHATEPAACTVESRGIGAGQALPVTTLGYAAGSGATITNLAPREAAYYKVTIPAGTPSWEFTLAPSAGEMMVAVRRGTGAGFPHGR